MKQFLFLFFTAITLLNSSVWAMDNEPDDSGSGSCSYNSPKLSHTKGETPVKPEEKRPQKPNNQKQKRPKKTKSSSSNDDISQKERGRSPGRSNRRSLKKVDSQQQYY